MALPLQRLGKQRQQARRRSLLQLARQGCGQVLARCVSAAVPSRPHVRRLYRGAAEQRVQALRSRRSVLTERQQRGRVADQRPGGVSLARVKQLQCHVLVQVRSQVRRQSQQSNLRRAWSQRA